MAAVEQEGLGYLMAVQGRRNPVMDAALVAVKEDGWVACEGWDGQPKKNGSQVQEVTGKGSETRRFLVHSPEREAEQRKLAAALIGESAGRILGANHGHRYYEWRLDEAGQLEYGESANCEQERRREGHWLLETEEPELGAVEAVRAYQDLWRVEAAFPDDEGRAGAAAGVAPDGGAGAGARAGGVAGTGARPGVGEGSCGRRGCS